jgi:hypothetical protein
MDSRGDSPERKLSGAQTHPHVVRYSPLRRHIGLREATHVVCYSALSAQPRTLSAPLLCPLASSPSASASWPAPSHTCWLWRPGGRTGVLGPLWSCVMLGSRSRELERTGGLYLKDSSSCEEKMSRWSRGGRPADSNCYPVYYALWLETEGVSWAANVVETLRYFSCTCLTGSGVLAMTGLDFFFDWVYGVWYFGAWYFDSQEGWNDL